MVRSVVKLGAVLGCAWCWMGAMPGCRQLIDADGYEVVETTCGEVAPAPPLQLVRSCVLTVGCSPTTPPWTIADCITWDTQRVFGGSSSAAEATTCQEVAAATGVGFVNNECDGQPEGWRCEGNRAIRCSAGLHHGGYYRDCNRLGGTCESYSTSSGTRADCRQPGACAETDGALHCAGSVLYRCDSGTQHGQNCENITAACSEGAEGADCYFLSPELCPSGVSAACGPSGEAQQCSVDGHLLKFPCAHAGLVCVDEGQGICVAAGCTGAQLDSCVESCNGAFLSTCVGGLPYSLDCNSFGFSRCALRHNDKLGRDYAVCSFE